MTNITSIGNIGNYYGGINITEQDNKYYWSITGWFGLPEYY